MSFIEEVKNSLGDRSKAEETIKQAARDSIVKYTKMVGWPHNRAHFSGLELKYLLLKDKSGWTDKSHIDNLTFHEVLEALNFITSFLHKEGFSTEITLAGSWIDVTITWENN